MVQFQSYLCKKIEAAIIGLLCIAEAREAMDFIGREPRGLWTAVRLVVSATGTENENFNKWVNGV